ncbi:MAG: 2-C-methyl-D-erythritol 4-phosphate cytidylyltransferase [Bacteroidota bacterium]|nr:2-C-methyl-D-erythritol 4-phosphate cytidylyltransferase [Bacteroidota bacterium]
MFTSVIIPAAGFGERMGASVSKQFLTLRGKPILIHTVERFQRCNEIAEIVITAQRSAFARIGFLVSEFHLTKVRPLVEGGERRQDSVANALNVVDPRADLIAVHDAVRPFLHKKILLQAIEKAAEYSAAVVAVRAKDTVKIGNDSAFVEKTLDRSSVWIAQTPQIFKREILVHAYMLAKEKNIVATDDSSLVEQIGIQPVLVEGSYDNIKITTPDDLEFAEALLRRFEG